MEEVGVGEREGRKKGERVGEKRTRQVRGVEREEREKGEI